MSCYYDQCFKSSLQPSLKGFFKGGYVIVLKFLNKNTEAAALKNKQKSNYMDKYIYSETYWVSTTC